MTMTQPPNQILPAVELTIPLISDYIPLLISSSEKAAKLAGLKDATEKKASLISEEIFLHAISNLPESHNSDRMKIIFQPAANGLQLHFHSQHLHFDPSVLPEYHPETVQKDSNTEGLSLHLIKVYAKKITFQRSSGLRKLSIFISRQNNDQDSGLWSRLLPSLAGGIIISPILHHGKNLHKIDVQKTGKSYLIRPLAYQFLALVDGKNSVLKIMKVINQLLPDRSVNQVEELYYSFVEQGVLEVKKLPPEQAEFEIKDKSSNSTAEAIKAYKNQQ